MDSKMSEKLNALKKIIKARMRSWKHSAKFETTDFIQCRQVHVKKPDVHSERAFVDIMINNKKNEALIQMNQ